MKLFLTSIVGLTVDVSAYRGISYAITQADNEMVVIDRAMVWERNGHYSETDRACYDFLADNNIEPQIAWNGEPSDGETCILIDALKTCRSQPTHFIYMHLTGIEQAVDQPYNFCSGYIPETFTRPIAGYKMSWRPRFDDWVTFTDDNGSSLSGNSRQNGLKFIAQVLDPMNNTPQVKLPSIWKIVAGCPSQILELNPVDLDGDTIRCRWATSAEALGAWHERSNYNSLTLDEENCIVIYNGAIDNATDGFKPIALQIEDFDKNGNMLSSMPLQFLASVWTPTDSDFANQQLQLHGPEKLVEDDDDITVHFVRRRRAGTQSYCDVFATTTTTSTTTTTTTLATVDIFLMIEHMDVRNLSYANYGCVANYGCGR